MHTIILSLYDFLVPDHTIQMRWNVNTPVRPVNFSNPEAQIGRRSAGIYWSGIQFLIGNLRRVTREKSESVTRNRKCLIYCAFGITRWGTFTNRRIDAAQIMQMLRAWMNRTAELPLKIPERDIISWCLSCGRTGLLQGPWLIILNGQCSIAVFTAMTGALREMHTHQYLWSVRGQKIRQEWWKEGGWWIFMNMNWKAVISRQTTAARKKKSENNLMNCCPSPLPWKKRRSRGGLCKRDRAQGLGEECDSG